MTAKEIEQFVMDQGQPKQVTVSDADWKEVYNVYRASNRDEDGVFIMVINTRIYPKSQTKGWPDVSDKPMVEAKAEVRP